MGCGTSAPVSVDDVPRERVDGSTVTTKSQTAPSSVSATAPADVPSFRPPPGKPLREWREEVSMLLLPSKHASCITPYDYLL